MTKEKQKATWMVNAFDLISEIHMELNYGEIEFDQNERTNLNKALQHLREAANYLYQAKKDDQKN